jgi:hypothetical protein
MIVKNDGDSVKVTAKKDATQKQTELESTELVAITPDSKEINISDDDDLMSAFMAKNNISATFTLSTEKVDWPTIPAKPSNDVLAMQTQSETTTVST